MPITYAITAVTHQRRSLFTRTTNAELMLQILVKHRTQNRYQLHAFAIMPDHLHVLLTPSPGNELARCVQFIKGGFSFAVRQQFQGEVWQPSYFTHRVEDIKDFNHQKAYIACNPTRKFLQNYPYTHTNHPDQLDPISDHLL